ncbi:MAG: ATP-binding protein [Lachnospiraceae bacterium]|nr:ATP-binding protein [Lachnospiraceae bacterium]
MYFVCFLITTIGIVLVLHRTLNRQEDLAELQSEHVEELDDYLTEQRMERISRYRHDLANHKRTLEALPPDAREPEVLKALYMIKRDACKEVGIQLKTGIAAESWEELMRTGECTELVSLLSNLWDNAIEAVLQMKDTGHQEIFFSVKKEDDGMSILLSNPYEGEPDFQTYKENRELHGYGLKIIREIIERKNGRMEIQMADHLCRIECFLPWVKER